MLLEEVANFVLVLVVTVGVAGVISSLYAVGLRLWARGTVDVEGGSHFITRLFSAVCFAACIVIVLFALWLMIPIFHQ